MKKELKLIGLTATIKGIVFSGSIVTVQALAYLYGAATVGVYSTALAAVLLFGIVVRAGLPVMLLRARIKYPSEDPYQHYSLLTQSLVRQPRRRLLLVGTWSALLLYVSFLGLNGAVWYFIALTPLAFVSAWLQLRSAYLKADGHAIASSVSDMGMVQLVLAALIISLFILGFGVKSPLFAISIAGIIACFICLVVFINSSTTGHGSIHSVDISDQNKILINALLTFLYRNGYPLIIGIFVSAQHLGYFRIEERLAFIVSFIVMLVETILMRQLIHAVKNLTGKGLIFVYLRFLLIVIVPTILLAGGLALLTSSPEIASQLSISSVSDWRYAVFIAAPLFAFIQFNTLMLNLMGCYKEIAINMIVVFTIFAISSYMLYPSNGLSGIRFAYLLSAVISSVWIGCITLRAILVFPREN